VNAQFLALIAVVVYFVVGQIRQVQPAQPAPAKSGQKTHSNEILPSVDRQLAHIAANITLFPPLFLFSALYYTDIASLLSVLLAFHCYMRGRHQPFSVSKAALQVLVGAVSLSFRQTNVFWVAIFPMGLTALDVLESKGNASFQIANRAVESAGLQGMLVCPDSMRCPDMSVQIIFCSSLRYYNRPFLESLNSSYSPPPTSLFSASLRHLWSGMAVSSLVCHCMMQAVTG
jgi:hypothetical protein